MSSTLQSRSGVVASALFLALLAQATAARPQGMPGFQPNTDYVLEIDGRQVEASIFHSGAAGAYLIVSAELDTPLLLAPGRRQVDKVHIMKVAKQADGSINLLPDPLLGPLGSFEIREDGLEFDLGGREAVFREKPPLLGIHGVESLRRHSAEYQRLEASYQPQAEALDRLRRVGDEVRVAVYFGTWCPFCQQMVPRIMKVAQALDGSKVHVDFYGLPRDISSDPEARRLNVRGVPTGVVYLQGQEIGRIQGNGWTTPERSLAELLAEHRG